MRRIRAIVTLTLLVSGVFQAISGLILYFAPRGRGIGDVFLYGFAKHVWKDLHFYVGILIVAVAVLHLTLNWKMFKNELKALFRG